MEPTADLGKVQWDGAWRLGLEAEWGTELMLSLQFMDLENKAGFRRTFEG